MEGSDGVEGKETTRFVASVSYVSFPSPALSPSSASIAADVQGASVTRLTASQIRSRGAGTGRALIRDLYANGEWKIFSHLSAIVPHGGTIGCVSRFLLLDVSTSTSSSAVDAAGTKEKRTDRAFLPSMPTASTTSTFRFSSLTARRPSRRVSFASSLEHGFKNSRTAKPTRSFSSSRSVRPVFSSASQHR